MLDGDDTGEGREEVDPAGGRPRRRGPGAEAGEVGGETRPPARQTAAELGLGRRGEGYVAAEGGGRR